MADTIERLAGLITALYEKDAPDQAMFDQNDRVAILTEAKKYYESEGSASFGFDKEMEVNWFLNNLEHYHAIVSTSMTNNANGIINDLYSYFSQAGENSLFARRVAYLKSFSDGNSVCETSQYFDVMGEMEQCKDRVFRSIALYNDLADGCDDNTGIGSVNRTCRIYGGNPLRADAIRQMAYLIYGE